MDEREVPTMEDTALKAMQSQTRFESEEGDTYQNLYDWLCDEIAHANASGIDWIVKPSRLVESLQDYNNYKLVAQVLMKMRSLQGTTRIKVA